MSLFDGNKFVSARIKCTWWSFCQLISSIIITVFRKSLKITQW